MKTVDSTDSQPEKAHDSNTEQSSIDATSTTDFNCLAPQHISIDRLVGFIVSGIVSIAVIVAVAVSWFALGFNWIWYLIAGAAFVFILFLFWIAFIWPVWEFETTSWRLGKNGLEIHRGVFWKHRISIPVARVQHADVSQGPLQRRYELGKLTVHTAGTHNASIELTGISHQQAIELRDEIVNQRKSADVV